MIGRLVVSGMVAALVAGQAATLQVGPGKQYAKPCQAIAAAAAGDTIEIDSKGSYVGDACAIRAAKLTIRGIGGGRAHIEAGGAAAQGKGIWVVQESAVMLTVENIEFSGAKVSSRNGAGIRVDPNAGLVVRNCHFHDNEDGILTGDAPESDVIVENSIFERNGYGDAQSHNIYVNHARRFVFRGNYSARSVRGQLVKTRAAENHILYNRLSQETGNGSRELDIPNGGLTFVIGNVIEQQQSSENGNLLGYMPEGPDPRNPSHQLYVINNTFINGRSAGVFIDVPATLDTRAVISNNIFVGPGAGTMPAARLAILSKNYFGDPGFVNAAGYDFRLRAGSPAIDAGVDPGVASNMLLAPAAEYVHPACSQERKTAGAIDLGAFEYGSANDPRNCIAAGARPTGN